MYSCKKEDVAIVIALALLFSVSGMFFFSDFLGEDGITGAAVGTVEEVGVPEEENISMPESTVGVEIPVEGISNDIPEEAIAESNIQSETSDEIGVSNLGDGQITGAINLSTGASTAFNGIATSDNAGDVLTVGDINGDGFKDIIIGAPDATVNGITNAGAVYVVYDAETLPTVLNLSQANITFSGHNNSAGTGSRVGYSLATGNFNNDSYADLAIGAYLGGTSVRSGRVYLIYGGNTLPTQFNLTDIGGNLTLKGITSSDNLGSALTFGDVNGDGIDDLLVGAKGAINHSGEYQSGEAYIIYGSTASLTGVLNSTQANVTMYVHESSASLADKKGLTTGDVNQDGYDDILVSGTNEGSSYFVYSSATLPALINLSSAANLTIGVGSFDTVIIGDVNGDGFPDLIGSDPGLVMGGPDGVFIYYGKTTFSGSITGTTNYNVSLMKSQGKSYDVGVTDFNKDGFIDIVVGAPTSNVSGGSNPGVVYLFYGPLNYTTKTNLYINSSNATLEGASTNEYAGATLATENINSDGFGDLLIGAYGASPNDNVGSGRSYLYYGKVACTVVDRDITLNQNINANGSCFIINTSNVVLNGSGYTLIGNGSGIGINLTGVSNVTVRNFNLNNFSMAMFSLNTSGNNFTNGLIQNSNVSFNFTNSTNNIITNVTFNQTAASVVGTGTASVKWYVDVTVNDSSGNLLSSVNVTGYNNTNGLEHSLLTGTSGTARLILTEYVQNSTVRSYVTNHTINATKSLYSQSSQSINLTQTNNTQLALTLNLSCGTINENFTFSPTTIYSTGTCFNLGASGLTIDGAGLTIIGNGSGAGINITGKNQIYLNNINIYNFSEGISINGSNNTNFVNLRIANSTNKDVLVAANGGVNITLTNTTFNRSSTSIGTNSNIQVKWYVDVTANNSGYLLSNANVTAYNRTGGIEVSNLTNSNGLTRLTLTEFIEDSTGKSYFTSHNVTAIKSGYNTASQTVNLTNTNSTSIQINVLGNASCSVINQSIVFQNAIISASGTCFNITTSNINVNGNNTLVYGNSSNYGFYISGANNVTISGFELRNFTSAAYLSGVSNLTFQNFILTNNTYGITLLSSSAQNNFTNGLIANSTISDVNMSSGTDNYLTNVTMSKSSISSGDDTSIIMRWYIDAYVNDTSGNNLANATAIAYKADGTVEDTQNTSVNGYARLAVSEFSKGMYGYTYITPHTIAISKAGYFSNLSTTIAIDTTNNTILRVNLPVINCNTSLTTNITLGSNLTSNGTCFVIGSNSININGNGYYLIGNNSGIGINLSGRTEINITNLKVTNYTYGLSVFNSNSSVLSSIQATNNTYGIFINQSNNNNIYDSTFANNSASNIFVTNDGNTNNSLINVSVDINTINVTGTATLFKKWYATVNVTFGSGYPLGNVNATGYFNSSGAVDYSAITDSNGIARLELAELKKNSSGVYYLTPHNVTVFFNSSSGYSANSTTLNISVTNNTNLNFSLSLNCTAPYNDMRITQNTVLCPGTWIIRDTGSVGVVRIMGNYSLTCDSTTLQGDGRNYAIYLEGQSISGVNISGCTVDDYNTGILGYGYYNLRVNNFNATSVSRGISAYSIISNFTLTNFYFSLDATGVGLDSITGIDTNILLENGTITGGAYGIGFSQSNSQWSNAIINNVNFIGGSSSTSSGIYKMKGDNITIRNSTFSNNKYGIYIDDSYNGLATNATIYHNTFEDSSTHHAYYRVYVPTPGRVSFNTSVNVSGNMTPQGNSWDDYCGLSLSDSNGDGYADSGSSYPYSSSNGGKVSSNVTDYGPKVLSCPSQTPSSSGSSSGSTTTVAAVATPTVTPTTTTPSKKTTPPSTELLVDTYTPEEARKFIKTTNLTTTKLSNDITAVTVTLENTGTKKMYLFPELQQEIDDPYFIITRKTLGFSDSLLMKLSQIVSSGESISGRLLKAEIVNSKEIVLNPGEKVDQVIEIKEGLSQPRQLKMQFTTNGVSVNEKEFQLEKKPILGTAVDVDSSKKTLDLYAVIVPSEKIGGIKSSNRVTGAFIGLPIKETDEYFLELEVIKENADGTFNTKFNELYGPYDVKQTEPLIFAQQLKYGEIYTGKHIIRTKIYHGLQVAAENEFGVEMG